VAKTRLAGDARCREAVGKSLASWRNAKK